MGSYSLNYTPWSRVLLGKLTSSQLVKKFPTFYGTLRFITAFTSACHLSLSWATLIQSMPPHPTSWRSIFILSSHLRLGLPSGLFPSGFPTKTLITLLLSPIRATCPPISFVLEICRVQISAWRTAILTEVSVNFISCRAKIPGLYLILGSSHYLSHPSYWWWYKKRGNWNNTSERGDFEVTQY